MWMETSPFYNLQQPCPLEDHTTVFLLFSRCALASSRLRAVLLSQLGVLFFLFFFVFFFFAVVFFAELIQAFRLRSCTPRDASFKRENRNGCDARLKRNASEPDVHGRKRGRKTRGRERGNKRTLCLVGRRGLALRCRLRSGCGCGFGCWRRRRRSRSRCRRCRSWSRLRFA